MTVSSILEFFRGQPVITLFLKSRGFRLNAEWLSLDNCPVGYTAVPYPVGGNGDVFHANLELNF